MTYALYALLALLLVGVVWFLFEKSRRRTGPIAGGIDRSRRVKHTHDVELYSNSFSHCSRKARIVVAELGIPAKHHHIDLIETGGYQTISREYLRVNPAGLVPTLVHEGHPVFESDDILAYAQSIAPQGAPQLVPDDPQLKQKMDEWLDFCAIVSSDLLGGREQRAGACIPGLSFPMFMAAMKYIPLKKLVEGFLFHPKIQSPILFSSFKVFGLRGMIKQKRLTDLMHSSRDCMLVHLETLNSTLKSHGHDWVLGDRFTLADITLGCMLERLSETGWLEWFAKAGEIDGVLAYFERIKARPAWKAAIIDQAHPIVEQAKRDLRTIRTEDQALAEKIYGPLA